MYVAIDPGSARRPLTPSFSQRHDETPEAALAIPAPVSAADNLCIFTPFPSVWR